AVGQASEMVRLGFIDPERRIRRQDGGNRVVADRSVFFFQAEDGIRDRTETGVQTCALPILRATRPSGSTTPSERTHSATRSTKLRHACASASPMTLDPARPTIGRGSWT